jgi:site-specific DNA-cytosine methylase
MRRAAQRHITNYARNFSCPGAQACLTHEPFLAVPAVDLFCGFGGVTAGMLEAGLDVRLAVDFDAQAVRAHRAYHPNVTVTRGDVSQVRPRALAGRFVWASPSCKPWSMANTSTQRGQSHREYFSLVRLARLAVASQVLVIENVPGLLFSKEGKEEFKRLERECNDLRLSIQTFDLTASELGFEQERRRMFIVIGAPLVMWQPRAPGFATHATVTTKSTEALAIVSERQGIQNPLELQVPDFRSGRRRKVGPFAVVSPHTARRLVGNAIPPLMARVVCENVLNAIKPFQRGLFE